jgi:hypothetical protein
MRAPSARSRPQASRPTSTATTPKRGLATPKLFAQLGPVVLQHLHHVQLVVGDAAAARSHERQARRNVVAR